MGVDTKSPEIACLRFTEFICFNSNSSHLVGNKLIYTAEPYFPLQWLSRAMFRSIIYIHWNVSFKCVIIGWILWILASDEISTSRLMEALSLKWKQVDNNWNRLSVMWTRNPGVENILLSFVQWSSNLVLIIEPVAKTIAKIHIIHLNMYSANNLSNPMV